MTDINFQSDLLKNDNTKEYISALNKLQGYIIQENINSLKDFMIQFNKISDNLLNIYKNCKCSLKEFDIKGNSQVNHNLSNELGSNNDFKYEIEETKEKIHIELKNMVINKYIRIITNQDSIIQKQSKELEKIKKQFEKIITKNDKFTLNSTNDWPGLSQISSSSKLVVQMENKNTNKYAPFQDGTSNISTSFIKETKKKQRDFSMPNRKLLILDVEAEKIYNEPSNVSCLGKTISQSPINCKDLSEMNVNFKENKLEKSISTKKFSKTTPIKETKERKIQPLNKNRNVVKYINSNEPHKTLIKNNTNHPNFMKKNVKSKESPSKLNRSVTPGNSTRINTDSKQIDNKNTPIHKKTYGNKKFINSSLNESIISQETRKSNKTDNNHSSIVTVAEKRNHDYSQKMLQKYYEMLGKFNRKFEDQNVLISKEKKINNNLGMERKIIYVKDNEKMNMQDFSHQNKLLK